MNCNTRLFRTRRTAVRLAGGAVAVGLAATGCGQDSGGAEDGAWQPTQPIEYIAPAAAGGGWDALARTSARVIEDAGLSEQQFQVVNTPGGGGSIAWAEVAQTPEEPHQLFVTSPPILFVPLAGDSEYDYTDFTPIAMLATEYEAIAVAADSPYESFAELMDAVSEDPAGVSIAGGSSPGSMDHVALAGAAQEAGVTPGDVNYVPFDGGGEALTSLVGGNVDAAIVGASEGVQFVESGDIRMLAVTGAERSDALPDVPTLTEEGVDYTFDIWRGVMGPGDLTGEQVAYYEQLFADMVAEEAWQQELEDLGWVPSHMDSQEFGGFLEDSNAEFEEILAELEL